MNTNTTAHTFEQRSYGLKELAVLYFPNIAPASASTRLKKWITTTPALMAQLAKTNYRLTARILTPRQVQLITNEFGEP